MQRENSMYVQYRCARQLMTKIKRSLTLHTDFYRLLVVTVDCDQREIKKAYHRLMLANHPDKGGSTETTKILNHAKDWLSDTDRRKRYDVKGLGP